MPPDLDASEEQQQQEQEQLIGVLVDPVVVDETEDEDGILTKNNDNDIFDGIDVANLDKEHHGTKDEPSYQKIRTLEETLLDVMGTTNGSSNIKNRGNDISQACYEEMTNFQSTPDGPNGGVPMKFWSSWELNTRPRRIALILDDCQEEYRGFATDILDNLQKLCQTFRNVNERLLVTASESTSTDTSSTSSSSSTVITPIVWSTWCRRYDDGISNAMDRWYGCKGLKPYTNALYISEGLNGMKPLKEIEPTCKEIHDGWFFFSKHLDIFWNFTPNTNKSYLDEKLKLLSIDTIVIAGLWTDECILSTAFAGLSRGYDVVVVSDAVATATSNQQTALTIVNGTCGKVLTTQDVCDYMNEDFILGKPNTFKGINHPDGRIDN